MKRKLTSVKLWALVATLVQINAAFYYGALDGGLYVGGIITAFAVYSGSNVGSKFAFSRILGAKGGREDEEEEVGYDG